MLTPSAEDDLQAAAAQPQHPSRPAGLSLWRERWLQSSQKVWPSAPQHHGGSSQPPAQDQGLFSVLRALMFFPGKYGSTPMAARHGRCSSSMKRSVLLASGVSSFGSGSELRARLAAVYLWQGIRFGGRVVGCERVFGCDIIIISMVAQVLS